MESIKMEIESRGNIEACIVTNILSDGTKTFDVIITVRQRKYGDLKNASETLYFVDEEDAVCFIEAFKKAHADFKEYKGVVSGNSGHSLTYINQDCPNFPTSLTRLKKLRKELKSINEFWT